jgi:hypothetical protein
MGAPASGVAAGGTAACALKVRKKTASGADTNFEDGGMGGSKRGRVCLSAKYQE